MSSILLETLKVDLPVDLQKTIDSDSQLRTESEKFLQDLLINDQLLSTETYTTTTNTSELSENHKRTLIEEIAELDSKQHDINLKLAAITNENRDFIIDISHDLNSFNKTVETDYNHEIDAMLKVLDIEASNGVASNRFHVSINEKLTDAIKINNSILTNIDSVLDLLELPTLCKLCILQGNYQESLEISILVQALLIRFPKLVIFQRMQAQVEQELKRMVRGLIKLLNTNLKQNNILKIFQILNKLDILSYGSENTSSSKSSSRAISTADKQVQKDKLLKIIYLSARFKFITSEIAALKPLISFNKLSYLKRFIEIYREYIFNSLSIYFAIFGISSNLSNATLDTSQEDNLLINQFIRNLALLLVQNLKKYLPEVFSGEETETELDIQSKKNGLILQIIYLCKSLSKYKVDFEPIILHELVFQPDSLISEQDWTTNISKVRKFRS
ncbi:predicted protein [Scheffersomyces stipitis CBS 6054]|uniref:Conserved oligomeric Golgi complex subunit 8 n=1 Tax=Scheffersomyces stipitis (strain ATCC 58785 / CBS 6054 / NBRC 10063 / NRRL Y-11545) TaxID=322104 RepID=A3LSV0_PICST|nr:predicted protein [Scheffersomyces stipitis CBS 6054]ABN65957.2 predicted protein [Scheffersomyces stipitis CBS 6054]